MRPACAWDQTEIVLKASIEDRDQPLAAGWVQAAGQRDRPDVRVGREGEHRVIFTT